MYTTTYHHGGRRRKSDGVQKKLGVSNEQASSHVAVVAGEAEI